jgi:outer membrane lipoprotein-sorting protein
MMNEPCRDYRDAIGDLVSGTLTAEEAGRVAVHAASCAGCEAYLEALRAEERALSAWADSVEPVASRVRDRVMADLARGQGVPASTSDRTEVIGERGSHMRGWMIKVAGMAAALALVSWGVWQLGLVGQPSSNGQRTWWSQPAAAWAQGISAELDRVETLVYREGITSVGTFGTTHLSGSWRRHYQARDRSRVDQYYEDTLVSTEWHVPDDGDLLNYAVSYEYECYTLSRSEGGAYERDPVELLRFYVSLLDRADHVFEPQEIDGHSCVGFEISAARYGSNPESWIDRVWFDVETKLPVRIEKTGRPVTDHPEETATFVLDEFAYHASVPFADFEPVIPDGYANAHPDEIRARQEREAHPEFVFADVPEGLKAEILAAMDAMAFVRYRVGSQEHFLSRDTWRTDTYAGDKLVRQEWTNLVAPAAPSQKDPAGNAPQVRQTILDCEQGCYRESELTRDGQARHLMDALRHPIGFIDRADRYEPLAELDGRACIYIELSSAKFGTNPPEMKHLMWFDVATKLPVRMEFVAPQDDGSLRRTIREDFVWEQTIPEGMFTPQIPAGMNRCRE